MNTIIEKIRAEIERRKTIQLKRIQEGDLVDAGPYDKNEAYNELLDFLSGLENSEKQKRVRTLEEEFDGYNPIVVTLDKYVLEGIGVGRHGKVIIKIQRKED